ncbi:hypothetical protein PUNSTDRAFT_121757 [Punctularia strigosozonata HHB-11173 SS5]|uniref:uncharacterized protein n=1 Tax=Punctularia strigosozonata (strain HHB-11173) TaxID=741275 RepID=UPI000441780E|nr:uncharacterized protein PUNSTDRAFT_121757 [Punctularia strigosozonata HHB-11173 SS5]EIN06598.1 hypothetical protein PUNSTDRAFT_121757 [Punctularia strigosozonata HHB-11173 SS5]
MPSFLSLSLLAASAATVAFAKPLSTYPYSTPRERSQFKVAPLHVEEHPHGTVNNSYIVMLKSDLPPALMQNHMNFLQATHEANSALAGDAFSGVSQVYDGHVKGYAGKFSDDTLDAIRTMPEVEYVERDQIVRTQDVPSLASHATQKNAPWGLARVSHRKRLSLGTFSKYEFEENGGEGVDVYVIDTGINVDHVEFEGRASWGKTMPQNDQDIDGNGHGTHCAGTIASRAYGVAKAAHVIAVKVLGTNGSGTMSDVVGGVVWAAQQATAKMQAAEKEYAKTGTTKHKGSVANMSLGGGKSRALDDAVNRAVEGGMHFAVAAGNDNRDACNYSPAAAEKAVTVGASTLMDERAYFSNHGKCVDVLAPGLNIKSTWIGSEEATNVISGTSMASPHTAGMLAYLLSLYPSQTFNPDLNEFVPSQMNSERTAPSTFATMYSIAHASLPSWAVTFLPPPQLVASLEAAPTGPKTLSPAQLKAALIALSSKDVFAELPDGTPNLLIFNNATA